LSCIKHRYEPNLLHVRPTVILDGSDQIFSTFKMAAVCARVLRQASASLARSIPYVGMISFSLGSQPLSVSSLAKHFSSTPIAMEAAVDAPGEAPSRATRDLSAAATSSVPNSNSPALCSWGLMI